MVWRFLRPGGKVQEDIPPPGIEDNLSYTARPGAQDTPVAHWYPEDTPDLQDDYFNTIDEQDSILVHWYRPPADTNPQPWWDDKDPWSKKQREDIETQIGVPWTDDTSITTQPDPDPRWNPPVVTRPTAFLSPSNYRFTRPYDQYTEHELNGIHLSLAENRRAYLLGGQAGLMPTWNNSYRLDPVTNDASAVFVGDTTPDDLNAQLLITRQVDVWASPSYRLDG